MLLLFVAINHAKAEYRIITTTLGEMSKGATEELQLGALVGGFVVAREQIVAAAVSRMNSKRMRA